MDTQSSLFLQEPSQLSTYNQTKLSVAVTCLGPTKKQLADVEINTYSDPATRGGPVIARCTELISSIAEHFKITHTDYNFTVAASAIPYTEKTYINLVEADFKVHARIKDSVLKAIAFSAQSSPKLNVVNLLMQHKCATAIATAVILGTMYQTYKYVQRKRS